MSAYNLASRADSACRNARYARNFSVPSMNIDLEVEVLWGVGRNDPSEPQGTDREGC